MKYTLDMDFSALEGAKAVNWVDRFQDILEYAFSGSGNHARLLANLLMLEQYACTVRHGLAAGGKEMPAAIEQTFRLCWDCLEGRDILENFEDFANNLWACTLHYNVGEEISDTQAELYREALRDIEGSDEWLILTWFSLLLMEHAAIMGKRLDFEEFEDCEQVSFIEAENLLNMLADACIDFTETPFPSSFAKDYLKALDMVYQPPLFRQIVCQIQNAAKAALAAAPADYPALREEYRNRPILPDEFAEKLLKF